MKPGDIVHVIRPESYFHRELVVYGIIMRKGLFRSLILYSYGNKTNYPGEDDHFDSAVVVSNKYLFQTEED